MCPLMSLQAPKLRESLVTLGTGIRFLSSVNSHVSPQVLCLGEGLCTLGARVRGHATVGSLVYLKVTGLGECCVTNVAGEELFFSMGQVV